SGPRPGLCALAGAPLRRQALRLRGRAQGRRGGRLRGGRLEAGVAVRPGARHPRSRPRVPSLRVRGHRAPRPGRVPPAAVRGGAPPLLGPARHRRPRARGDAPSHARAGERSPGRLEVAAREPDRVSTRIGDGVVEIDTLLGGWEKVTAGYLVEGPDPVLVETGSQTSVPALLAALDALGVGADDLAGVAVTHIHLDHAGGVGDVAKAFPNATIYVHEKGARHLADPARLVESASRVYGHLLDDLYGRLEPTPAARLHVLADGEEIEVGPSRVLTTVDSPGHAKHHLALHDSQSGILFVGDAVGVRLPDAGLLRPSTPPPDFDLDQAVTSMRKFAARRPAGIAL